MNKQETRVRGFLIRSLNLSDRKSKIQKLQQARREFKNKSGKKTSKFISRARQRKAWNLEAIALYLNFSISFWIELKKYYWLQ
ncbi:hypothetical protein NIES593_11395 [Hydrococcus rivularis NIES-593]|uniref:Uncharacterized protein n=1 Tax=Hydrococcus rivularis NIES-593 TaxID=1921803 RepID=A0A1U7HHN3_9CYAN|nr:hypothetical protein NIES593_11395 [Hydrococcus rivularis NIES-593]